MSLYIWLYVDTGAGERIGTDGLNITHNVARMWSKAGVYDALYESAGAEARTTQLALESGIGNMLCDPDAFRALNPPNGWGDYDGALRFLREWADECRKHPRALIGVRQ